MKLPVRHVPLLATIVVFLLAVTAGALRYPGFLSVAVFINLLRDNAYLGVVAVGMTFVILSGGIDLSVGAMIGLVSICMGVLIQNRHIHPILACVVMLGVGSALGAGMGVLITRFKLPPFMVTLAGMFLARGLGFMISQATITIDQPLVTKVSEWTYALPIGFVAILVIGMFLAHLTSWGRTVYAIGGNEKSALLMGLPVRRTTVSIYALSGFCSALGGIFVTLYTSSGNPSAGSMLELDAIAAVVIGGTLLTGGVGSLLGTFFGVLLLAVIQTGISFEGTLSSWWTRIIIGLLLMLFILLQKVVERSTARGMPSAG